MRRTWLASGTIFCAKRLTRSLKVAEKSRICRGGFAGAAQAGRWNGARQGVVASDDWGFRVGGKAGPELRPRPNSTQGRARRLQRALPSTWPDHGQSPHPHCPTPPHPITTTTTHPPIYQPPVPRHLNLRVGRPQLLDHAHRVVGKRVLLQREREKGGRAQHG